VILLGLHWYVLGALMTCESPALSLRVRRRLPQSFLGRALGTWFNPGPGTGYVFAVSGMLGLMLVAWIGARFDSLAAPAVVTAGPRGLSSVKGPYVVGTAVLMLSYVTFYLGLGLLLIRFVRRFTPVGMLLGVLLHVVLVVAGTLLPLVIQLSSPTLYHEVYSLLQITNPFWTIGCAIAHWTILSGYDEVWVLVPLLAILVFCANLPGAARELRAVRVAQPRRVAEEDAALAAPRVPVRTGPWDT